MARRTVVRQYAPNSHTVKFFNGRVRVAELTFSSSTDAEKVASIWETSTPDKAPTAEHYPSSYTLF